VPAQAAVTLALRVADVEAAAAVLGDKAVRIAPGVLNVAPAQANGVILELAQV